MCRGIREAKFTWAGSKYRPRNKIRTLAWASLQASPVSKSYPVLFQLLEWGALACLSRLITNVMNVSKEAMRGISFSLSLYLFLSIMIMDCIYFLDGSRGGGDQKVAGEAADGARGGLLGGLQIWAFIFCCRCFVFFCVFCFNVVCFKLVVKQLSIVPDTVSRSEGLTHREDAPEHGHTHF